MDQYTQEVKNWLDERFRKTSAEGVFMAHQPIYGFRRGFCEPGCLDRYLITYEVLRALAGVPGETFLDVGGAEGYKAYIVRKFSGMRVRSSDLSKEACKRAEEIFGVDSDEVDSHALPYGDGEFDVVLSSESIEHVTDYKLAVKELIRVAKKCVIITVPHDPIERVRKNIAEKVPHAHIHAFDTSSFDYLRKDGLEVASRRMMHPWIIYLSAFVEANPREWTGTHGKFFYRAFNSLLPIFRVTLGKRTADWLMRMDSFLCRKTGRYWGILFIIMKNGTQLSPSPRFSVSPRDVLDEAVPLHYLKG